MTRRFVVRSGPPTDIASMIHRGRRAAAALAAPHISRYRDCGMRPKRPPTRPYRHRMITLPPVDDSSGRPVSRSDYIPNQRLCGEPPSHDLDGMASQALTRLRGRSQNVEPSCERSPRGDDLIESSVRLRRCKGEASRAQRRPHGTRNGFVVRRHCQR
jgi:hypothetical protein